MQQSKGLRVAGDNILLIAAYYLLGLLSMHFLATPPSNGSPIWPPAGISLAAVLLRGNSVLPGVFIGDLLIAARIFGFSEVSSVAFSLMVGLQAMLAAWLGAFLVNRVLGRRTALLDNHSIILFFLFGGPISQIVPSALAIGGELWLGVINYGDFVSSFITWWVGNSIGVVLFTPLVLIFIGQPASAWRPRIVTVFLPLIVLCLFGVWFFTLIIMDEQQRLRDLFDRTVNGVHQQIVEEGSEVLEQGENVKLFISAVSPLSVRQFKVVSRAALKERYEISALSWISGPRLEEPRTRPLADLGLMEPEPARQTMQQLSAQDERRWHETLNRARQGKQNELTGALAPLAVGGEQRLSALVLPVFGSQPAAALPDNEKDDFLGYLTLFFDHGKLIDKARDLAATEQILLSIGETDAAEDRLSAAVRTDYGFEKVLRVNVLGKFWTLTYKPSEEFVSDHTTFSYWWVFIAGCCVICLFGFILLSVTGQTLQVRKLVDEKTHQLNNERRLLESILNNVREGILSCDKRGRLTMLNRAAREQYGMQVRNLSPRQWAEHYDLMEIDGQTRLSLFDNPLYRALTGTTVNAFELMMRKNDVLISLSVNSQPLRDEQDRIVGAVASFQDITSQKRNINELKKLSLAVHHSPAAIMITDITGNIEYVNDKFEEVNGYSLAEIIGKKPNVLKSGQSPDQIYKTMWETLLNGRVWHGEILNQKKNGEYYWAKQFIAPVRNEQGKLTHFVSIMEDVTEVKKRSEIMSYQASHDDLTGLLNRRECEIRLQRVIKSSKSQNTTHVFCFLDLDKFKNVNDTCGHSAGDELLRRVAGLLQRQLRQRDTLARLGGDEFGIIMEHCRLQQAKELAEKICNEVNRYQFHWQDQCFGIGVSIGLAEINKQSLDFSTVIEQADQACYRVKAQGRGQVALYREHNILPFE